MKRQCEAGQQLGGEHVAGFGREFDRPGETLPVAPVDAYDIELGIHDPVLGHAGAFIQGALDRLVASARAWRTDFHHELGDALHVGRGQDLRSTGVRHVEQVGLHNVEPREDHVEGRVEQLAGAVLSQPLLDEKEEIQGNALVLRVGRRRHVVLSVDQLVPLPIVGKQHEVVVGELHAAGVGQSAVGAGHELHSSDSVMRVPCRRDVSRRRS